MTASSTQLRHIVQKKSNSAIQKLWDKIEKMQTRTQNLRKKIADCYQQFEIKVLPHEHQYIALVVKESQHLISFMTRRSFTNTERDELTDWIKDNLDYLHSNPFVEQSEIEVLMSLYNQQLAQFMDHNADQWTEQDFEALHQQIELELGKSVDLDREQLEYFARNPEKLWQYLHATDHSQHHNLHEDDDSDFDFFDDFNDPDNEPRFDQQHAHNQQKSKHDLKIDKLFKESELNRLYKKLANKLHPDKEMDEDKKNNKHKIMLMLAEARKNNDAFTLLQLYVEHFPEDEQVLHKEILADLEPLLQYKLRQLEDEYHYASIANDLPSIVWQRFHTQSKAKSEKNIAEYLENLQTMSKESILAVRSTSTVKTMKKVLRERMSMNRDDFSEFQGMEDLLDELFAEFQTRRY